MQHKGTKVLERQITLPFTIHDAAQYHNWAKDEQATKYPRGLLTRARKFPGSFGRLDFHYGEKDHQAITVKENGDGGISVVSKDDSSKMVQYWLLL